MDVKIAPTEAPLQPDEITRLWQHALHEEGLFHTRLNVFSGMQVGLLAVFAVLYNKEPSFGVFIPVTIVSLALTLLWLWIQVRHWSYCSHLNDRILAILPEYRRTMAAIARTGCKNGLAISRPLSYAVPLLFATVWMALFSWVVVRR